jgi:hypothetical protein
MKEKGDTFLKGVPFFMYDGHTVNLCGESPQGA